MSTPNLPIEKIKAGMRATWMAGDFGVVAKNLGTNGTIATVFFGFWELRCAGNYRKRLVWRLLRD